MTLKLTRLSLGVSDLSESEVFYRDALGLPVERRDSDLFVRWPDLLLVLTENPPSARGKFHFGFKVESDAEVDAWAERLRARGVRVIGRPISQDGIRKFFFLDPDQYEIEIYRE